jgi:O-antigen/teichoic acid export membrane protein
VRSGFYLISGTTLATVIMAIAAILIGRLLGPEMYGDYNLAILPATILLLFSDLGINTGIIKFASSARFVSDPQRTFRIISHAMLFRLIAGLGIFIFALLLPQVLSTGLINRPSLTLYVQIASISILFQIIFTTSTSAFIGLDRTELNALTTNIQATAKTAISVGLVLLGFGMAGAVLGFVGGYVVAGIAGGLVFARLVRSDKTKHGQTMRETFRILASYGLPLYVSVVLIGFMPLLQQVILAFFTSSSNFGNYRAALNFVQLISIIPVALTTALLPAFSRLDQSTVQKIRILFKRSNKYICLLIMPATIVLLLFSKQIVQIVYGSTFNVAWFYLSLSCIVYFLAAIGYLGLGSLFNGLGETRITLRITLINIITFVIIAPILTATYDVPGVIISSIISATISTAYAAFVARRKFKVRFDLGAAAAIYIVSGISALPPLALLFLTKLSEPVMLAAGVFIYLSVYITMVPLTGIIDHEEIQVFKRFVLRIRGLDRLARPLLRYEEKILNMRSKRDSRINEESSV